MAGGRPTKLTKAIQNRIVRALKDGCTMDGAAAAGGINRSTLYGWLEKGRAGEAEYLDFLDAVTCAREASESVHLRNIAKAGSDGDWRASAWILERRMPEHYGNRLTLVKRLEQMTSDELDEFIARGVADAPLSGEAGHRAPDAAGAAPGDHSSQ
jgi:hypothetical protein